MDNTFHPLNTAIKVQAAVGHFRLCLSVLDRTLQGGGGAWQRDARRPFMCN